MIRDWRETRSGALAMSAGTALIVVNDSIVKVVSEGLPAAQTIGLRGVFASLLVLIAVVASGQARLLPLCLERRTITRALLDVGSTFSYLFALFQMPLAEATAIGMAAPLIIVLLAVIFLREQVSWQRWAAVSVGFAGMLLIVRPGGASYNWWAVLCFVGTIINAARDVYTARISVSVPSLIVTLTTAVSVMLAGLFTAAFQGWQPVSLLQVGLLASASAFLASAYYLMVIAMRLGDASVVGGFRYSGLPAAALLGWAVWGYLPDLISMVGMVSLVLAGLYILRHERLAARARDEAVRA